MDSAEWEMGSSAFAMASVEPRTSPPRAIVTPGFADVQARWVAPPNRFCRSSYLLPSVAEFVRSATAAGVNWKLEAALFARRDKTGSPVLVEGRQGQRRHHQQRGQPDVRAVDAANENKRDSSAL